MSSVALQRVLVRMLYDEGFARRAIGGREMLEELNGIERDWICAADLRPFRIDPYRRSRSLAALLEEYPASCAVVLRRGGGVAQLDAFFSHELFHRGMQEGRSLAALFGEYLQGLPQSTIRPLAKLECGVAMARRVQPNDDAIARWRLAPGTALLRLAAGTVTLRSSIFERVKSSIEAILDETVEIADEAGIDEGAEEYFLLASPEGGELRLEAISMELHEVLELMEHGAEHGALLEAFARHGVDADEAESILEAFVVTGELLRPDR